MKKMGEKQVSLKNIGTKTSIFLKLWVKSKPHVVGYIQYKHQLIWNISLISLIIMKPAEVCMKSQLSRFFEG